MTIYSSDILRFKDLHIGDKFYYLLVDAEGNYKTYADIFLKRDNIFGISTQNSKFKMRFCDCDSVIKI